MLENIELILYVFILFYFLIILYDAISLYTKKNEKNRSNKKKQLLIKLIINHENPKDKNVLKKTNRELVNKLKKLPYLASLGNLLEENIKIEELNNKRIVDVLNNGTYDNIFVRLATIYDRKESVAEAYYAYILKFIHPDREEIYDFLFHSILSSSIYSVENALFSLYHIGNSKMVCEAYKLMSRENVYYNYKLISDGMMEFTSSKDELCRELYNAFDLFNEETKIGVLTFFRNCKYDIKEDLLKRLTKKDLEKEVEIALIRYFSKVNYKEANKLFMSRLEDNYYRDFDYDVVMIQVLGSSTELDNKVLKVLENCLTNSNYYVRYNAAKVLHNKIDLRTIKNVNDPFMKDMIDYFISQEV